MWIAILALLVPPLVSLSGSVRALKNELVKTWHGTLVDLLDPYRPELHYMRGPGPRWQEKHRGHAR
jgi:hypothetical protein